VAKVVPKPSKGKQKFNPLSTPSSDGQEEEEEEEDEFEEDESVDPDEPGVNSAASKLLKLLQKEKTSSTAVKKEAEKVAIPAMPDSAHGLRTWRNAVRTEVTSASGKGEVAFLWIMETENPEHNFETLSDPGEFVSLDAKLASALTKLAKGELGREIVQQQELAAKSSKMLKGRHILWMVYQYYAVSQDAGAMYSITELMSVRLNDDKLETFLHNWNHVLAGMESPPANDIVE
jgi:hypothetical protein